MNYVHFFELNIQKDNHYAGRTDCYINVLAKWTTGQYYSTDNRPIVFVKFIDLNTYELPTVINWQSAINDAEKLAEKHFADIAKAERIAKARAELINLGEGIPTLERYESDLLTQQTLS